jgi:hypothetical protein
MQVKTSNTTFDSVEFIRAKISTFFCVQLSSDLLFLQYMPTSPLNLRTLKNRKENKSFGIKYQVDRKV